MARGRVRKTYRPSWFYGKSFLFFLLITLTLLGGYWLVWRGGLLASQPAELIQRDAISSDLELNLTADGVLFLEKSRLPGQIILSGNSYVLRWQVIDQPKEYIGELKILLHLPTPISEEMVKYQLINNGGALTAYGEYIDPQTIEFAATGVGQNAVLAIQLEVPQKYLQRSLLGVWQERLADVPLSVWSGISIAFPLLTLLVLVLVLLARNRRIADLPEKAAPPSRLKPAMVGILLKGRLTSREIAATLVDLARRGYLIISHREGGEYRFRRLPVSEGLEDFEAELLRQIFGFAGETSSSEEVALTVGGAFSEQVSQAFILAYRRIMKFGLFYRNPLQVHRRYQLVGVLFFLTAVLGFFANLFLFSQLRYALIFWVGMMIASLLIVYAAKRLPLRTALGDLELARWLAFGRFLAKPEPLHFQTASQDEYLSYLPYAIVLEVEQEWTRRLYDLPFALPDWYLVPRAGTIDDFTAGIFPLFGYLSRLLSSSAQPSAR